MSLTLYMDHHVDVAITAGLRRRGVDVLTAMEDGFARRTDPDVLARATQLDRVVFTLDHDFLVIAAEWQFAQTRFAGIVFGRDRALSIGNAVNDLDLIARALSPEEIESRVIWIPL
jgi:hypothetical protein